MTHNGLSCGKRLDGALFDEISRRAVLGCFKWNLAEDGRSTLCPFPVILERSLFDQLSRWAVALDAEARAAEAELIARPDLHGMLGLPWRLRLALRGGSEIRGCRYARFDFHPVDGGGFAITEGNIDVAGGFNEAGGVTALLAPHVPETEAAGDPAATIATAIAANVDRGATVGCMHMTNFVDDHQVVRFLARRFENVGLVPLFFGPSQLRWAGSNACVLAGGRTIRLDAVFRFFPADWLPRLDASSRWWRIFKPGSTLWTNPATTILTQSKRFPLAWPHLRSAAPTWKTLLPETRSPQDIDHGEWIIKPALAHEGYRVAMRGVTDRSTYSEIVRAAKWRPRRWVAQRRFTASTLATPDGPRFPCIGVYTVDGRVAGLYGRLSERPLIDDKSQEVVVLVRREP